jgi:hypothetical protein
MAKLDRKYARLCAVYRCVDRYGMSRETGIARMVERGWSEDDAKRMFEVWRFPSLKWS